VAAQSAELRIRADEPAAEGHFPGNPVVPAAVLLREVLRILSADGEMMCCEIRAARFFHPVRPGDLLVMHWEVQAAGDISFTCSPGTTEHRVLSGTIRVRAR
jgi:3-hydroxyacyl-[acyl-carrier-protein] dehydratase